MSGPHEPAPLAPPESDDAGPTDEGPTDEATPLPPAVPYHVADPTSWSLERLVLVPDGEPPVAPDDDTTIPEHLRSARMDELTGDDDSEPALADDTGEDEQTRPRVRFPKPPPA